MRRLAGLDSLDRAARIVVDLAALDLAEVKVVDGSDPAQQLPFGARQCADLVVADVVDRVGLQIGETNDSAGGPGLMGHDQIIGDGGDVHAVEGSGSTARPTMRPLATRRQRRDPPPIAEPPRRHADRRHRFD